ncbi:hypothetical protein EZL74_04220 [Flavobacterium silvisoli]|uniref:DUF4386 domain-containing protein n=1 Tax=Flavobacterium silvisoli TaxID=2529433 RepID=A0A4Q9Z245_9FLAO|nr:DUF6796 family protein [Flavobacterium silvisoli]TBX70388.1 hypothetical protein EZL74_04220 [Flavobacterium silvisoli]
MKKRIVSCLMIIGAAGMLFAFGDLLIPQENVIFDADKNPSDFAELVTTTNFRYWAARGFLGVLMEMIGTVGLYLYLQKTKAEKTAFIGLLLSLTHQILGFGVFSIIYFMFPVLGTLYQQGNTSVMAYATMKDELALLMGSSLLITLTGLAFMAVAIWRSGKLPKWSGWLVFLGFFLIPFP